MKFTPRMSEREALPKRIERLQGTETIRGVPGQGVASTLLQHCGAEQVMAALREADINETSFNPLKNYPLRAFLSFENAAATRLVGPLGGFDQAIFQLGAAAVDPFFDSVAGRTMKILSGHEPHRMLAAVPSGYQLLMNVGKHEYIKKDARYGIFCFSGDPLGPVHNSGIFDQALKRVYDINASFELESIDIMEFRLHIRW